MLGMTTRIIEVSIDDLMNLLILEYKYANLWFIGEAFVYKFRMFVPFTIVYERSHLPLFPLYGFMCEAIKLNLLCN